MENKPQKGDYIIIDTEEKDGILRLYYGDVNRNHANAYKLNSIEFPGDEIILDLTKLKTTKVNRRNSFNTDDFSEKEIVQSSNTVDLSFDDFLNLIHEDQLKEAIYIKNKKSLFSKSITTTRYLNTKTYLLKEEYWTDKHIVSFNLKTPHIIIKFEDGK